VSSTVLISLDLCVLAWHPKPVIMKIVFVQVCFESTGYTRAIPTMALSRLNLVDWWTWSPGAGNGVSIKYRSGICVVYVVVHRFCRRHQDDVLPSLFLSVGPRAHMCVGISLYLFMH